MQKEKIAIGEKNYFVTERAGHWIAEPEAAEGLRVKLQYKISRKDCESLEELRQLLEELEAN